MTEELRWILLGAGAALILGLWLWESIRARRKPLAQEASKELPLPSPRASGTGWREPRWDEHDGIDPNEAQGFELPAIRVQDDLPPLDPPGVDFPSEMDSHAIAELPVFTPTESIYDRPRPLTSAAPSLAVANEKPLADLVPGEPPAVSVAATPQDTLRRDTAPKQKIIALRVISPPGGARFAGDALRNALEREGLSFGRYSIFHRELEDNQVLFSVASLVEPGSFDLAEMPTREYPGVSLFAVLPGPFTGTRVFDEMLSAGRHLATKLGGLLQDDKRQPLTGQKVLDLRDSVEAFDLRLHPPRREGGA